MSDKIYTIDSPWGEEKMVISEECQLTPDEMLTGYLSSLRQDEVRGERHSFESRGEGRFRVLPAKVPVEAKFRTRRYQADPDTPRGRRNG